MDVVRDDDPRLEELLDLPPEERLDLAQALWRSVDAEEELRYVPIPGWQRKILDQRLEELDRDPDAGRPWEEVKKRLWPDL